MNNISPIRPSNERDGTGRVNGSNRPQRQPRDDSFRKSQSRDRRSEKGNNEVDTEDEVESPPSLFDLSRRKSKEKLFGMKQEVSDPNEEDSQTTTASKMRVPAKEPLADHSTSPSSPEQEPGDLPQDSPVDLTALTGQKNSPKTVSMKDTEVRDPRLFENFLTKNTDDTPLDELKPKEAEKTEKTEKPSPFLANEEETKQAKKQLAANELGRQQTDQVQAMKSHPEKTEETLKTTKKNKIKKERSEEEAGEKERVNTAAVNSSIQGVGLGSDKTGLQDSGEVARSSTIRDIASQIVEKMQVMRDNDVTKTIVTLKHPPILQGATVTLIVSDNAKNELNISFANLSPDAKLFLDRKLNEDSLTQTLERKGVIVHMVTTSTQPENLTVGTSQPSKEEQQQQQREQSQQQQQREREQQEEEEESR